MPTSDMLKIIRDLREWNIAEKEKTEYVFLEPTVINRRRQGAKKARANDLHLYVADEDGYICASCCGKFDLDSPYPANGKLSSKDARFHAAEKGREVCGSCVGSLYSNEDTD